MTFTNNRRRSTDRVTPDLIVRLIVDDIAPLIHSNDPAQILVAHNVCRHLRMLQS